MSLCGATVISSLASAIPVVGDSLSETDARWRASEVAERVWEDGGVLTRCEERMQSPNLMRAWVTSFPGGSFAINTRA